MSGKVPEKWDREYDVVVVGWGSAGTSAAVTAHDQGAKVVILEKMPEGGGNSRICGGNIIIPKGKEFIEYLESLSFKTTAREVLETFVEEALKNGDWIRQMGADVQVFRPLELAYPTMIAGAGFPHVKGAETVVKYNIKGTPEEGKPSQRLWKFLSGLVAKTGNRGPDADPRPGADSQPCGGNHRRHGPGRWENDLRQGPACGHPYLRGL